MKFSEVLKKRLKDRNLSQVARQLGIPKTLLHEWMNAKRTPSFRNIRYLKNLADYFSLSLDELLLEEKVDKSIINSLTFEDNGCKYRIKIERVKYGGSQNESIFDHLVFNWGFLWLCKRAKEKHATDIRHDAI